MDRRNVLCDIDRFAAGIEQLVGDIPDTCSDALEKSVRGSVRQTAGKLRGEYTAGIGVHEWSERYRGGFKSHVDRKGPQTVGEVGNEKEPGLVHLLEKGHATPAGRRTRAFPHMDPAFTDMENDFMERVVRNVAGALR